MSDPTPDRSDLAYLCGAIEIDAMQRRVLVDGAPAKLGARAFDVLLALVENRDRVVPKRELMDLVWPKLVVEENNLVVQMVALRKLLGAQAVATIPGRGYRFTMPVDAVLHRQSAASALAMAVPPATAASAPSRANLPDSPPLFGRAQDLATVGAMLRDHAVVTIVGAGGIGKTRLAMAAAQAAQVELPDGRWWVELAPVNDGSQVPNSIGAAVGLQLPSGRTPQEALATALSSQNLLIVLDSCEHLADEVASLVDQLRARAPGARLLLTSQELLKCRDEQVYRLGPLAVPEGAPLEEAAGFGAVALFVERAHAIDPRFRLADDNVAMVIDVCRRLDGIPLAIELAAARVPLLGVNGLHERLDQIFNVLTGGARMKLRRHQTLRAALEWSHGLLSADERTAFRRLGVFAGGFTLELAQGVVSDERIDQWLMLDLLGRLIDKSLVIADGGAEPRYRLLETTRAFALEQLAVAGESDGILRRHAQVVCDLMAAADARCWDLSPAERRRAVTELGNLRAAVDWAMAAPSAGTLAYELLGKCWLAWMHNGQSGEGVRRMLQLWPTPPDLPTKIEADYCLALSRLHEESGRDEQWQAARRAEALFRQLGDADRLGDALLLVATIALVRDDLPEAGRALREAEDLVTAATALRKQAALAATQGMYHGRSGVPRLAIAAFDRQRELYHHANAELGEYLAFGNLGQAQLEAGDTDAAIESLRRSVEGLRRINAPYGRANRLSQLAVALAWRGDDADILPLAREAYDHLRSLGVPFGPVMAAALHHARRNDLRRAALLAGYARSMLAQRKSRPCPFDLSIQDRVRDLAAAEHAVPAVDSWLCAGEALTEAQMTAIAFDDALLDELP